MSALRLAVGFLTVIPVRPTTGVGRRQARDAMLLGPVAVLPVALAGALVGWAGIVLALPAALAGVLAVAVVAFGTRALHLDGLADTVDGLGSGPDREKALRILRSGDVGPMGAAALVLALAVQAFGYGAALARPWGWVVVAVAIAGSRVALSLGCRVGVPAARSNGLGALFAGTVPVVGVVAGGAAWLLNRCVRRFGGMSGDVLGALVEVVSALLALVLAVGVAG